VPRQGKARERESVHKRQMLTKDLPIKRCRDFTQARTLYFWCCASKDEEGEEWKTGRVEEPKLTATRTKRPTMKRQRQVDTTSGKWENDRLKGEELHGATGRQQRTS
jgi:hypothetical protein